MDLRARLEGDRILRLEMKERAHEEVKLTKPSCPGEFLLPHELVDFTIFAFQKSRVPDHWSHVFFQDHEADRLGVSVAYLPDEELVQRDYHVKSMYFVGCSTLKTMTLEVWQPINLEEPEKPLQAADAEVPFFQILEKKLVERNRLSIIARNTKTMEELHITVFKSITYEPMMCMEYVADYESMYNGISLLQKFWSNLLNRDPPLQMRRLKKSNELVKTKLLSMEYALELMHYLGVEERRMEGTEVFFVNPGNAATSLMEFSEPDGRGHRANREMRMQMLKALNSLKSTKGMLTPELAKAREDLHKSSTVDTAFEVFQVRVEEAFLKRRYEEDIDRRVLEQLQKEKLTIAQLMRDMIGESSSAFGTLLIPSQADSRTVMLAARCKMSLWWGQSEARTIYQALRDICIMRPDDAVLSQVQNEGSVLEFSLPEHEASRTVSGLENVGNTCYMNSVLQSFFWNVEFRSLVLSYIPCHVSDLPEGTEALNAVRFIMALQVLFSEMSFNTRVSHHSPKLFASALKDAFGMFRVGSQEDVDEFFYIFFAQFEKGFKYTASGDLSATLSKITQLPLRQEITPIGQESPCQGCAVTKENVLLCSVKRASDLYTCIEETLFSEVQSYECPDGSKVPATIRVALPDPEELPPFLTIHLKRVDFDRESNTPFKVNACVSFPRIFYPERFSQRHIVETQSILGEKKDLMMEIESLKKELHRLNNASPGVSLEHLLSRVHEYACSGSTFCGQFGNLAPELLAKELECVMQQRQDLEAQIEQRKNRLAELFVHRKSTPYVLSHLVIHNGGVRAGHYWTYLHGANGKWIRLNDERVTEHSSDDMLRDAIGGTEQKSAVFLVYGRPEFLSREEVDLSTEDFPEFQIEGLESNPDRGWMC